MAERLRPRTQAQIYARPVDTFVQQGEVDKTRLNELSNFLQEINTRGAEFVKRGRALEQGQTELKRKKDKKEARKVFESLADKTLSFVEAQKKGLVAPEANPVYQYYWNEMRGENLGIQFDLKTSKAYNTSGLNYALDPTGFDDWFNKRKSNFIESNKSVLNHKGAFEIFNGQTKSTFNSLSNIHKAQVSANFVNDTKVQQTNRVLNRLAKLDASKGDFPTASYANFGDLINNHISDTVTATGMSMAQVNNDVADTIVEYYVSKSDINGLVNALKSITTVKGSNLLNTGYITEKVAEARVTIGKQLTQQMTQEKARYDQDTRTVTQTFDRIYKKEVGMGLDANSIIALVEEAKMLGADGQEKLLTDFLEIYNPDWKLDINKEIKSYQDAELDADTKPAMNSRQQMTYRTMRDLRMNPSNWTTDGFKKREKEIIRISGNVKGYSDGRAFVKELWTAYETDLAAFENRMSHYSKDPTFKDFDDKYLSVDMQEKILTMLGDNTDSRVKVDSYRLWFADRYSIQLENGNYTWNALSEADKLKELMGAFYTYMGVTQKQLENMTKTIKLIGGEEFIKQTEEIEKAYPNQ
jgi:hypothetical protein